MDNQILSELYYSIYENQEVLDEGMGTAIKNAIFGDPKSASSIAAAKKRREQNKPRRTVSPAGSRVDWDLHLGTSDKRKYHKFNTEECNYIVDYLVTEGFVNTAEQAEVVINAMSPEWIEQILSESL